MPTRVDVFSAKGGVGKTLLSYCLARAQARKAGAPVLLVDADLTGTCIGDLLEPWAVPRWHQARNLVTLACGQPERLPELLSDPSQLPVYLYRPSRPPDDRHRQPLRPSRNLTGEALVFCPSHQDSNPQVGPQVLHALLGHESAGGWVNHVIEQVIVATRGHIPDLAAVIVDHGPGLGALQWATLLAIQEELRQHAQQGARPGWHALVVTTRDGVDLAAAEGLDSRLQSLDSPLRERVTWVVNRVVQRDGREWRDAVRERLLEENRPRGAWFERRALPIHYDAGLADAYAGAALDGVTGPTGQTIEDIRKQLFGE